MGPIELRVYRDDFKARYSGNVTMSAIPPRIHFMAVTMSLADWSTNLQDMQQLIALRRERMDDTALIEA